jgi:hypothetical protein
MVLLLMITGCAGPMGTMHTDPPPAFVTSFDGSYRDTIHITSTIMDPSWCQTPGQPVITVANGQFSYAAPQSNVANSPTPVFQAVMAQDGSFQGQTNSGIATGLVSGTHMEGRLDGAVCIYAFSADRS